MTAFEDFVTVELPRRATLLTVETTGFDGDPNVAAPSIITNSPKGTNFLEHSTDIFWRKNTAGTWSSSGTPAGSDTEVQYNNGGVFGSISGLTFDSINSRINVSSAFELAPAGGGLGSTKVGEGSSAAQNGSAYGHSATTGTGGTAVGRGCSSGGLNSIAAGNSATAPGNQSSAYGAISSAALQATALGYATTASHTKSLAAGYFAISTGANRATFGTIGGSHDIELQCGLGAGVWGATPPVSQPTVIGSRGGNAALASLLTAIAATGLIIDGTTA